MAAASQDDVTLYSVVLGCADAEIPASLTETKRLFEWAYAEWSVQEIVTAGTALQTVDVVDAHQGEQLQVTADGTLAKLLPNDTDHAAITVSFDLPEEFCAPYTQGDVIGTATYTLNGELLGKVTLSAGNDVDLSALAQIRNIALGIISSPITWVVLGVFVVLIIASIMRGWQQRRRRLTSQPRHSSPRARVAHTSNKAYRRLGPAASALQASDPPSQPRARESHACGQRGTPKPTAGVTFFSRQRKMAGGRRPATSTAAWQGCGEVGQNHQVACPQYRGKTAGLHSFQGTERADCIFLHNPPVLCTPLSWHFACPEPRHTIRLYNLPLLAPRGPGIQSGSFLPAETPGIQSGGFLPAGTPAYNPPRSQPAPPSPAARRATSPHAVGGRTMRRRTPFPTPALPFTNQPLPSPRAGG